MSRAPIPTWFFVLVVVRWQERFLVVQESDSLWYLPAGRVEPGENFVEAAQRETLEEAGIDIDLEGILKIQHTPKKDSTRMRVIFVAHPRDNTTLKDSPDKESLRAEWISLQQLDTLPLRHGEMRRLFHMVAQDVPIHSLDIISHEGTR